MSNYDKIFKFSYKGKHPYAHICYLSLKTWKKKGYMIFEMRNGTIFFSHPEMATFLEDEKEMTKSAQPNYVATMSS